MVLEERATILVADDDPDLLELLTVSLRLFGHDVVAARDGRDALDALAEHDVDLAVLDVLMPRLTGLEVLRELRTWPRDQQPPVLMLSATFSGVGFGEDGDGLGEAFLAKPFTLAALRERVHDLLAGTSGPDGPCLE